MAIKESHPCILTGENASVRSFPRFSLYTIIPTYFDSYNV